MNKLIGFSLISLAILIVVVFSQLGRIPNQVSTPPPTSLPISQINEIVNYQAGFAIFANGVKRSFSNPKYHNLSADVFLTGQNPEIVNVKKKGATWDDFFKTLPMKVTNACLTTGTGQTFCTGEKDTLKFYLNGVKTVDLLDREIKDGDRTLISYGDESESQIQRQLNQVVNPKNLN